MHQPELQNVRYPGSQAEATRRQFPQKQQEIFAGPYDPHLTEIPDEVLARRVAAAEG